MTASERFEAWVSANQWRIAVAVLVVAVFLTPLVVSAVTS